MTKLLGILATGIGSISLTSCDGELEEDSNLLGEDKTATHSAVSALEESGLDNLGTVIGENIAEGTVITEEQEAIFRSIDLIDGVDTLYCSFDSNTYIVSMLDEELLYYAEDNSDTRLYYTGEVVDTVLKYTLELYQFGTDVKLYDNVQSYFDHLQTNIYSAFECTRSN